MGLNKIDEAMQFIFIWRKQHSMTKALWILKQMSPSDELVYQTSPLCLRRNSSR